MPSNTNKLRQVSSQEIMEIRQQMLNFALLHLKDPHLAEDVVQDAFINAYKYAESFKGEAALKTWIFAILKNKIVDLIKSRQYLINYSDLVKENSNDKDISELLFEQNGHWDNTVYQSNEWKNIEQGIYQQQFWEIFDICLNRLTAQQARVFMMRVHLELDSDLICQECEISTQNLHTLLYRARLQLQVCLSQKWFGG